MSKASTPPVIDHAQGVADEVAGVMVFEELGKLLEELRSPAGFLDVLLDGEHAFAARFVEHVVHHSSVSR